MVTSIDESATILHAMNDMVEESTTVYARMLDDWLIIFFTLYSSRPLP